MNRSVTLTDGDLKSYKTPCTAGFHNGWRAGKYGKIDDQQLRRPDTRLLHIQ